MYMYMYMHCCDPQTSRDGEQLIEDLKRCVSRSTGFDAVMRVRASTGLRPTGFYGAFYMSNTCLLYTSPSPRDATLSRMPSSA